jgi:uncharacterized protein (DUF302 family)
MRRTCLMIIILLLSVSLAWADSGLISIQSSHDVKTTADRLEKTLRDKGMKVFIRIDHALNAQKANKELRPTELLIFGNPNVGTPLMQCRQSVAIDLPQKALIWEDEAERVWLSYNDPEYLADRHGITQCKEVIQKIDNALSSFARSATKP